MLNPRMNLLPTTVVLAAIVLGGCGYRIAEFAPGPVVVAADDRDPISLPAPRLANDTLYQIEARTEHHVVQGMVISDPNVASDINRLDEVVASTWHRGSRAPITLDGYVQIGPPVEPLVVLNKPPRSGSARGEVVVRDVRGHDYDLFFDLPGYPQSRTAAWPMASRLVHALGYHCAEVHVTRSPSGQRAVAVRRRDESDLGPTPILWTRGDDPNDVIEREDRRTLRASLLWMSWLDVTRVTPATLRDYFVGPPHAGYVEHRFVDLSSAFGVSRLDDNLEHATKVNRDRVGGGMLLVTFGLAPKEEPESLPSEGVGLIGYPAAIVGLDRGVSPPFAPHDHARPDDLYWMARRMGDVPRLVLDRALASAQIEDVDGHNRVWRLLWRRRYALQLAAYSLVTPVRPRGVRMSGGGRDLEVAFVDDEARLRGPFERSYDVRVYSGDDAQELARATVRAQAATFGVSVALTGPPPEVVVLRVTRRRANGVERSMEAHVETRTGRVRGVLH